jgi:hypothetical protein
MAREVLKLEWWKGPLDFYHFPSSTGFEIDGEGHFRGQWGEGRGSILKRDIVCCLQALAAGGRLVRISHRDMGAANLALIIQEAISSMEPSFILLSAAYATAGWGEGAGRVWYRDELLAGLQQQQLECESSRAGAAGCIWIRQCKKKPSPKLTM